MENYLQGWHWISICGDKWHSDEDSPESNGQPMLETLRAGRWVYLVVLMIMLLLLAVTGFPPLLVVLFALQFAAMVYGFKERNRHRSDNDRSAN